MSAGKLASDEMVAKALASGNAHLVIPSYLSGLCIVHAENGPGAHVRSHELVPARAAATGKVLLAFRQPWRDSVLSHPLERITKHTIVVPHLLAEETDRIRRVGFATECDEAIVGVEGRGARVRRHGRSRGAGRVWTRDGSIDGRAHDPLHARPHRTAQPRLAHQPAAADSQALDRSPR